MGFSSHLEDDIEKAQDAAWEPELSEAAELAVVEPVQFEARSVNSTYTSEIFSHYGSDKALMAIRYLLSGDPVVRAKEHIGAHRLKEIHLVELRALKKTITSYGSKLTQAQAQLELEREKRRKVEAELQRLTRSLKREYGLRKRAEDMVQIVKKSKLIKKGQKLKP